MLIEPKAVSPKMAFRMIGVGVTKGYELLAANELESFKIGRATRITTASIDAFIARQLASRQMAA